MSVIEKAAEAFKRLSCRGEITHAMKQKNEITRDKKNEHDLQK